MPLHGAISAIDGKTATIATHEWTAIDVKLADSRTVALVAPLELGFYMFRCLSPGLDGAPLSGDLRDALWDRFFTAAPQRQRRSV